MEDELFSSMRERWSEICEFPGYSVSDHGRVKNDETGYVLRPLVNQRGFVHVGLTRDRRLHKRSVNALVAHEFVPPPPSSSFNTPINRDGDKFNNHHLNLLWRPRWFALRYTKQFPYYSSRARRPVIDVETGIHYDGVWDAAIQNGLLAMDIQLSIVNNTRVWPTWQIFCEA